MSMSEDIAFLWDWRVAQGLPFLASTADVPALRALLAGADLHDQPGFEWVKQAREDAADD